MLIPIRLNLIMGFILIIPRVGFILIIPRVVLDILVVIQRIIVVIQRIIVVIQRIIVVIQRIILVIEKLLVLILQQLLLDGLINLIPLFTHFLPLLFSLSKKYLIIIYLFWFNMSHNLSWDFNNFFDLNVLDYIG